METQQKVGDLDEKEIFVGQFNWAGFVGPYWGVRIASPGKIETRWANPDTEEAARELARKILAREIKL